MGTLPPPLRDHTRAVVAGKGWGEKVVIGKQDGSAEGDGHWRSRQVSILLFTVPKVLAYFEETTLSLIVVVTSLPRASVISNSPVSRRAPRGSSTSAFSTA